jgi:CRP-like cAMP-binding protein
MDGDRDTAQRGIDLLRRLDLFATLPEARLEQLAQALVRLAFAPGAVIVREGDDGGYFYVISAGEVEVIRGARLLAIRGPGEYFGEIALLRDIPRTATVVARTAVTLCALDGPRFVAAVSGEQSSRRVAAAVVAQRLA